VPRGPRWNRHGRRDPDGGADGRVRQRIREEVRRRRALGVSAPGEEQDDVIPLVAELNDARRLEKLAQLLIARGHSAARWKRFSERISYG
jgi:hypothetical protein